MPLFDTVLIALIVFRGGFTDSPDPTHLIQQVSENYHHLRSFEFAGHLTTTMPDTRVEVRIETVDAEAGHSFVPANSLLVKYQEAKRFGKVTMTDMRGNAAEQKSGFGPPGRWGSFDRVDIGVKSVTESPSDTVDFDGGPVHCRVVEVEYDNESTHPEELRVKYWIDANKLLVLKEEFVERQGRERPPVFGRWVYTVDSMKLNQPPPQWLVDFSSHLPVDHARPEWMGGTAQDFVLSDLDGHQVNSFSMRGRVVVLDFWATWCGPCRKELPIVEKISADYKSQDVQVLGISQDEEPSIVIKWMSETRTEFRTVIDPDAKVAEQYEVHGIPTLVVIDTSGKVRSYFEGNQTEQSLRSAIDLALQRRPGNR